MSSKFELKVLPKDQAPPEVETVSAVFLLGFVGELVLSCRNERGWDIPGGHVERGESLEVALQREVQEEAGASVYNPTPYALLSTHGNPKAMLFYASSTLSLHDFSPRNDAFERKLMSTEDLLRLYHGDATLLQRLIREAQEILGK